MKNNLIMTAVIVVIVGGISFYAGMQYQKSSVKQVGPGQFANNQANNQDRPTAGVPTRDGKVQTNQGGRPVSGEITSLDSNTLTVKSQDGGSVIVIYSETTNVNQATEASVDDLKVGDQVMVMGSEDKDGTMTAQTISIGGGDMGGMPRSMP